MPKQVVEPPRREMRVDRLMKRNDMTLRSADERHVFSAFLRQSDVFAENFSIGLVYHPREEPGSFTLLRCNGQHGGERVHPHHAFYHIHKITAADLNAGILEPKRIEQTNAYASFRQALQYFCGLVAMQDAENYFPGLSQTRLFPGDEINL